MRDIVDARDLNADEDRARHGRFGFHDLSDSTNRAGDAGAQYRSPRCSFIMLDLPTRKELQR
jgi:hypothetical protein